MRVLIIRFSSFGDIFQALEAAKHLSQSGHTTSIDWLVREDFAPLLQGQEFITRVYGLNRMSSALDLVVLVWNLALNYDHVYDAHSNLRSLVARAVIRARWLLDRARHPSAPARSMITRSKERIRRFLFFKLRLATLPMPYRGAESYVLPLRRWLPNLEFQFSTRAWTPIKPETPSEMISKFKTWRMQTPDAPLVALAPSAAWPNKRWPVERWRVFVQEWLETSNDTLFLLLGGPDDEFLNSIEAEFGSSRVFNAVGRTTLLESSIMLSQADALVANDTGLLHVADRLQMPSVEIVGPTAFGYPVSPVSRVAEVSRLDLPCKPCSKDGRDACTNSVQLKCLVDVTPSHVVRELKAAFESASESRALT